jgi:hypothetical protein
MMANELSTHCRHCGGARVQTSETMPYVGPGPRVVELLDVHMLRCVACGNLNVELPEALALDLLVKCLAQEVTGPMPSLAFEQGRWCIIPHRSSVHGT